VSRQPKDRTDGNGTDDLEDLDDLGQDDDLDVEEPDAVDVGEVAEAEAGEPDDEDVSDLPDDEDVSDLPDEDASDLPDEKVHFDAGEPLLEDAESYRARWLAIQTGFVDEPLYAVESAGRLLTEVLGDLASTFAHKRSALEREWRHGGDTATDDLRVAFQNYRAFFNRVVST